MKIKNLLLFLVLKSSLLFSQKMISYKTEKHQEGKTLFGGRIVQGQTTIYRKITPTVIIFDTLKNTVQIANKRWEIIYHDEVKYEGYDNLKHVSCYIYLSPPFRGDYMISVSYDDNNTFTCYYIKPSQWKLTKFE